MHRTFELNKGANYNIEYFLQHDTEKNWKNWFNFAQYARFYLGDKKLSIKCAERCFQLNSQNVDIPKQYEFFFKQLKHH